MWSLRRSAADAIEADLKMDVGFLPMAKLRWCPGGEVLCIYESHLGYGRFLVVQLIASSWCMVTTYKCAGALQAYLKDGQGVSTSGREMVKLQCNAMVYWRGSPMHL